jgi:CHRD domain
MARKRMYLTLAVAAVAGLVAVSIALAGGRQSASRADTQLSANLTAAQEVPPAHSRGRATFTATLTTHEITFRLDFAHLTGPPGAAHIHVGAPGVNGGVAAFLCGGGSKPACPASTTGTVTGTIVAADVLGPAAAGINPGDFAALAAAIKAGNTYTNMHTAKFPSGEIRGQISAS